ncbi:MAG: hypothetical protein JXB35_15670 [Anaerolineae bacterium]|nr:hypothetical protein [Anaerolineae bacterium]
MTNLPITRMTLYKHGVGFFERRTRLRGEKVDLSFRVEEMNDILKSLTAIDWGGGKILGIDYATPQSREELLQGCSIRLDDERSLRDLLVSLRGRRVRLQLDQGEMVEGVLLGLDEPSERHPMETALVSLLLDEQERVSVASLNRVQGVIILDERGAGDLRFFLQTALSQEHTRSVTIRLSPGEHDISVSYIAPAPTWRVSYRLVADADDKKPRQGQALLQAWGIFDNRLEEDLREISLSLVAGMPISFIYDLYTPFTPERPVVEEESRVAPGPVEYAAQMGATFGAMDDREPTAFYKAKPPAAPSPARLSSGAISSEALQATTAVATSGAALGELFQYVIGTPVTVSRGQSAMVPIVAATLEYGKDLLYNGNKLPAHPVATLRLKNTTGLTLERGPVTVIERGEYVGEAVLPFTVLEGELVVPYAVELGAKVQENQGTQRTVHSLSISERYMVFEEWDIRWRAYQITNTTPKKLTVLVEHPRNAYFELFESPTPKEQTGEHLRFEVVIPARGETTLRVQERRLIRRREELRKLSYADLGRYLQQGLVNARTMEKVTQLLKLWEAIEHCETRIAHLNAERQKIYQSQQQIQGNMQALTQTGKEGALRVRYVEQLEATEERLREIDGEEKSLKGEIERLQKEIEERLHAL